jgi:hypothetical protein
MSIVNDLGVIKFIKKHQLAVGIPLVAFGFAYQVVGAWILWDQDYPFTWQTEIAKNGSFVVWTLFIISLVALVSGCVLLYRDSVKYHKRHPEIYQ